MTWLHNDTKKKQKWQYFLVFEYSNSQKSSNFEQKYTKIFHQTLGILIVPTTLISY